MRLIDADLLRNQWLYNGENEYIYDTNAFLDSIDEQPTAFDKEKVIEELDSASRCMTIEHSNYKEHLSAIDRIKAIGIVKGGGVDDIR